MTKQELEVLSKIYDKIKSSEGLDSIIKDSLILSIKAITNHLDNKYNQATQIIKETSNIQQLSTIMRGAYTNAEELTEWADHYGTFKIFAYDNLEYFNIINEGIENIINQLHEVIEKDYSKDLEQIRANISNEQGQQATL